MRYSGEHKEETRRKVVKAAAAALRAKGPDGVGVAEIMAEAGLTHGGFYAHFPSKEALVAEAVGEAFDQSRRRFGRMTEGMADAEALAAFVDSYVSQEHRLNRKGGCPVVSLGSDAPRQGAPVREAFDRGVRGMIARVAAWLPADLPDRESLAASAVAEMAGSVSLSWGLADEAAADRLLADARRRIKVRLGLEG